MFIIPKFTIATSVVIPKITPHICGIVFIIPKLNAYKVGDLKNALIEILNAKNSVQHIPVRQGEKFHELVNWLEEKNWYKSKKII